MKESDEGNVVPEKEIEVKTEDIKISMGIESKDFTAPRHDLSGLRLTPLEGGPVYMVNPEGYLQLIPDPQTYNLLFVSWAGIHRVNISGLPMAPPISHCAVLAKGAFSNGIYFISNFQKRLITSPAVFNKYYFNFRKIYIVPDIMILSIPTGPFWS